MPGVRSKVLRPAIQATSPTGRLTKNAARHPKPVMRTRPATVRLRRRARRCHPRDSRSVSGAPWGTPEQQSERRGQDRRRSDALDNTTDNQRDDRRSHTAEQRTETEHAESKEEHASTPTRSAVRPATTRSQTKTIAYPVSTHDKDPAVSWGNARSERREGDVDVERSSDPMNSPTRSRRIWSGALNSHLAP